jgi:hypothetical protein
MYNRVVAHNVAVIALGIDQPFLVVMRAFFQIGQRDSFFALTVSLGDAAMACLGTGIQINHGVHAVLANELAIPFRVDIVFDVLDDAVVMKHIHEYVFVSTERPLNDDDFAVRVFGDGIFEQSQATDVGHHLECECVSVLVFVEFLQDGESIFIAKLLPHINGFFEEENLADHIGTSFGQCWSKFGQQGGFTSADVAFNAYNDGSSVC